MRPYFVTEVILDEELRPVVVLSPTRAVDRLHELVLVWVEEQEAAEIAIALEGTTSRQPLTHDLVEGLLDALGSGVERIELRNGADGVFDAVLVIRTAAGRLPLACCPADAFAMAVRGGVPVQLDDPVIGDLAADDVPPAVDGGADDADVEAFHRFIEDADPRDFSP